MFKKFLEKLLRRLKQRSGFWRCRMGRKSNSYEPDNGREHNRFLSIFKMNGEINENRNL
jgi:hypothetical protein